MSSFRGFDAAGGGGLAGLEKKARSIPVCEAVPAADDVGALLPVQVKDLVRCCKNGTCQV